MKILELFVTSKEEKEKKQAERVAKALKRGQEALLDELEAKKDKAQDIIDGLLVSEVSKVNTATFNKEYHDAKVELVLIEQEIKIAKEVNEELYTDGK